MQRRRLTDNRVDSVTQLPVCAQEDALHRWTAPQEFWDDLSGKLLDLVLVRQEHQEEIQEFQKHGVYAKVPEGKAVRVSGKRPIAVRWVDVNKGDDDNPNYRSRLVAREIRRRGEDPMFAPIPPVESLRTVLSFTSTEIKDVLPHERNPESENRTQVARGARHAYDQPVLLGRPDTCADAIRQQEHMARVRLLPSGVSDRVGCGKKESCLL